MHNKLCTAASDGSASVPWDKTVWTGRLGEIAESGKIAEGNTPRHTIAQTFRPPSLNPPPARRLAASGHCAATVAVKARCP